MNAHRHVSRGQALVELAVGLLIFTIVAIYGIHFAEVGYLSLKVPEAAVAPLWDSTALRVHRMEPREDQIGDFSPFASIAPDVEANARARYADFDGRSSSVGNRSEITQVFTRMDGLQLDCQRDDRVAFDVPRSLRPILMEPVDGDFGAAEPNPDLGQATDSPLDGIYENVGGISCSAQANLQGLPTLPGLLLDHARSLGQGLKAEPHEQMKACATGQAVGGVCSGRYGILLGDFGFSDADASDHCPLQAERPNEPCRANPTFYYAAMKVFDNNRRSAGRAASEFAEAFAGYSPVDESGFFMSYRGEEDDYIERDTPRGEALDEIDRPRNTGGPDHKPSPVRRNSNLCFLGVRDC
ncbi:pilus assembly protein [Hyalangium versicolor]|uniref:pilus assembly protein n=1 Tax=Hyalangium versicolor TaxID=2861190 RepID=UPI001CCD5704|nr:pilus assembly protein [Hyalangium versicolor]